MLVHIAGHIRDPQIDTPIFRAICRAVQKHDSILALGWIEPMIHTVQKGDVISLDWNTIVSENIEAIKRSDVVIIEISKYNFSQGFLLATALACKKPTLALYRDVLPGSIITGFKDPLSSHKKYTNVDELEKYVTAFLQKNTIATKDLRFNFLMDRKIARFLNKVEQTTGKNKSEIIREIVERKIRERS